MLQSSNFFFYSILFKIFLSSHLRLLNHLSLFFYHVFLIRYSYLSSVIIVLFYSILSVIDLCKLFSFIHLKFRSVVISVLFSYFPLLILRFPFVKVAISFFVFHSFKTCSHSHIERFGQTCMTKEYNPNEPSLCYRLLIAAPGRMLYVQTVTLYSAQPDFDIEISHCSCSAMRGHNSSSWVSNERR